MENIRKYLELKDMSQKQLAKITGIYEQNINAYCQGTRHLSRYKQIKKIADALGITPETLMSKGEQNEI